MYNRYKNGTEAYFAMQDAITAVDDLDSSKVGVEDLLERLVDEIDTYEADNKELEEERDQLQRDFDDEREKFMELHALTDLNEIINHMTQLKLAGEAIVRFADEKLVAAGALNASKDSDSDSGTGGDDSGQVTAAEGIERTAAEGITRPQIP